MEWKLQCIEGPYLEWLIIYLLHTLGELCLSPVGLSSFSTFPTKNCWIHDGSVVFGLLQNFVAGEIAKATATDVSGASADVYDLVQKQSFIDVYTNVGLMAVGVAFVLLLLSPTSKFKITRNKSLIRIVFLNIEL